MRPSPQQSENTSSQPPRRLAGWLVAVALIATAAGVRFARSPTPPVSPGVDAPVSEPALPSVVEPPTSPRCGDGRLDLGELCDPPGESRACAYLVPNADTGSAVCTDECTWHTSACLVPTARCGNGALEAGELCDDGNLISGDGCDATCVVEIDGAPVHVDGSAADERIDRALAESPCRSPDVREGARRRAIVRLEYELVVCQLPSGDDVFPVDRIRESMAEVAAALRPAGIELAEDRLTRRPIGSSGCRVRFGARELLELAPDPTDPVLPVIFVKSISGSDVPGMNASGFAAFGYGAVLAATGPELVTHELGHALGLLHTHACLDHGGGSCETSGDGLCDTPYDPGPDWLARRCRGERRQRCDRACGAGLCDGGADPDRSNPMSYYSGCRGSFSPDQLDMMRCLLDHDLAWLTALDGCGSELCNGRDDDCDGDVDEGDACEALCEPVERLVPGRTVGRTHGRADAFGGSPDEGYPQGTPDVLFELRPSSQGAFCLRIESMGGAGAGGLGAGRPVVTVRDGCTWDAEVLSSNLEVESGGGGVDRRVGLGEELDLVAGPEAPAFVSVDGWGRSEGVEYALVLDEGSCRGPVRLSAPRLMTPSRGRVVSTPVELSWASVDGAEAYELRLNHASAGLVDDPPCATCDAQIVDTTRVSLGGLPGGRTVHWTVRALRGAQEGPFAPRSSFEVRRDPDEPRLTAPTLLLPESGAVLPTLRETFSWEPVEGAMDYELRIGLDRTSLTDDSCDRCVGWPVAGAALEPDPTILGPDVDYWWTARARRGGETGPFARPQPFTVEDWACTRVGRATLPVLQTASTQARMVDDPGNTFRASCGGDSSSEHVWLIVPRGSERLCIDTEGSVIDTVVSVRTHCGLPETEIACNDEGFDDLQGPSRIELDVVEGEPLFVIVDGFGLDEAGPYTLNVLRGPCR